MASGLKTDRGDPSADEAWRIYTLLTRAEAAFRTSSVAIVDTLAQFAIVPVLDAHESQRAQGLRGSDAATPGGGVLEAALQIQADLLDQIGVLAEECIDTLQDGF